MDNCSPHSDSVETFETPVCLSNESALKTILQNISFLERKYGIKLFPLVKFHKKLPIGIYQEKGFK